MNRWTSRTRVCHATSMLKRALTIALIVLAVTGLPSRSSGQNIEGGPAPYDGDLQRLPGVRGRCDGDTSLGPRGAVEGATGDDGHGRESASYQASGQQHRHGGSPGRLGTGGKPG